MLPASRRLKRPVDFSNVVRHGSRGSVATVVVHIRQKPSQDPPVTRVGFVVSKKVGNAVVRNRVKRRLRHLVAALEIPDGFDVVVRALPAAAQSDSLAQDVNQALEKGLRKLSTC